MAIRRGSLSALLAPTYRKVYVETGTERPLEYTLVANVSEMEWNPVTDQQVAGLGTMPAKPEGRAFSLDELTIGGTRTYTANPYGLAVEVTFEAWRDELYGVLNEMIKGLARAARHRQETQFWAIFNDAFTGSYYTGFNSVRLCYTSQTAITGAGGSAGANRPSVEIGLSVTGIQNMITRFEGMTNESGLPQMMAPSMILTRTTAWFGMAPKGVHDINFLWRDYEIFDMFDDPRTRNAVATSYQRFGEGFGSWRGVDGSTG